MARSFRMYGKKRGHRRTGSKTLGNVGEALFFAFFFAMGSVFFVLLLRMPVWPEWRANHNFVETPCTVLETRVGQRPGGESADYRAEVEIRYTADHQTFDTWTYDITYDSPWAWSANQEGKQRQATQFHKGQTYSCWYDPQNPQTAVVVRGYSGWLWSLMLLPLTFIGIGGGGLGYTLLHWGKSAEHRAATVQLAARLELFDESAPEAKDFPHVPRDANLINSPGTRLKYRLPIHSAQGWKLLIATLVCLLWNGIVAAFVVMAIGRVMRGEPYWLLVLFIVPFLAAGVGIVYLVVRQLLIATGVGPTHVEISDHPLLPGRRYDLFLSQAGHLTIEFLEVWLVCDEQATYVQGTDTRSDRRRVFQQQVFRREQFETSPGSPFEQQCRVEVPADAMHSFRADHNEVQWKFVVRGEVSGWPAYERSFPIIVYPRPVRK